MRFLDFTLFMSLFVLAPFQVYGISSKSLSISTVLRMVSVLLLFPPPYSRGLRDVSNRY